MNIMVTMFYVIYTLNQLIIVNAHRKCGLLENIIFRKNWLSLGPETTSRPTSASRLVKLTSFPPINNFSPSACANRGAIITNGTQPPIRASSERTYIPRPDTNKGDGLSTTYSCFFRADVYPSAWHEQRERFIMKGQLNSLAGEHGHDHVAR